MRAPRGRTLLAAVGATLVAALLASGAADAKKRKIPIPEERRGNFFGVVSQSSEISLQTAEKLRRANVRTMRFIVPWSRVEATRDHYDWGFLDRRVGAAHHARVVPIPLIFGFPEWMSDTYAPLTRPEYQAEFQEFLRDLVRRYGPDGFYDYYAPEYRPLRSWQIWNEVNLPNHLAMDQPQPADYVAVVRLASDAIREVDPGASIISAGLAPGRRSISAPKFIRGVFKEYERLGRKPDFNEVAVHPYGSTVRVALQRLRTFRRAMDKFRAGRRMPILIGELGWASALGRNAFLGGNPRTQARKLRRSFKVFHKRRKRFGISAMTWFSLDDAVGSAACSFCPHTGLFRNDGEAKPSWRALRRVIAKRTGGR